MRIKIYILPQKKHRRWIESDGAFCNETQHRFYALSCVSGIAVYPPA